MGQCRRTLVALVMLLPAFLVAAQAQFETRLTVATLQSPESIAVGDFNHDGKLDVAVAAFLQSDQVTVLLGKGDGTFRAPVNYAAGVGPRSVIAADLNGDGKLDLAVADFATSGTVAVLLGNGDGTFQTPKILSTPETPNFVAVGDFNGDHKLDLVVGEQFFATSQAQIFLGNGDGTFQMGASYAVGTQPSSIAVGSFRRNGRLDLAVASNQGLGVAVLLGNGDGTFQQAVTYASPGAAYWVASADLNGDGKLDLAVANFSLGTSPPSTEVSVFIGNGDGTFGLPESYPTGGENTFVASGDFNGDKELDLVVTDALNNDVLVLLNTGRWDCHPQRLYLLLLSS